MTEAPPIGSVVSVTKINHANENCIGLKFQVEEIKTGPHGEYATGIVLEDFKGGKSIKKGHSTAFYLPYIELFIEESKKLGEIILIFKEGISDALKWMEPNCLSGIKFVRTYLNGRNTEYIYDVTKMETLHLLMDNSTIKSLVWMPNH